MNDIDISSFFKNIKTHNKNYGKLTFMKSIVHPSSDMSEEEILAQGYLKVEKVEKPAAPDKDHKYQQFGYKEVDGHLEPNYVLVEIQQSIPNLTYSRELVFKNLGEERSKKLLDYLKNNDKEHYDAILNNKTWTNTCLLFQHGFAVAEEILGMTRKEMLEVLKKSKI